MIRAEGLCYQYPRQNESHVMVFEGLDFTIEKGNFVAILGHNGCGKSTLAKHFNGILLPTGGSLWVEQWRTQEREYLFHIRSTVGMVFQNPDNQIVATVVEEDVAFALENLGVPSQEIRQRVDAALRTVGMYEMRLQAPHLLSGGQKQRVAIAGVLAMEPSCIVLDEPTAMLDPVGRQEVMQTIWSLNKEKGVTVILITHHMEEAALADRLVVMDKGEIKADGTPKAIFQQVELLEGMGLTVPQTVKLLWELKQEGFEVDLSGISDEECVEQLQRLLET